MMTERDSRLLAEQRRRKILELIEQKGQITVRELVERFCRLVGYGARRLGCLVLTGHGGSISRRSSPQVGSKFGLAC